MIDRIKSLIPTDNYYSFCCHKPLSYPLQAVLKAGFVNSKNELTVHLSSNETLKHYLLNQKTVWLCLYGTTGSVAVSVTNNAEEQSRNVDIENRSRPPIDPSVLNFSLYILFFIYLILLYIVSYHITISCVKLYTNNPR